MIQRSSLSGALVTLGIIMLIGPAVFPVQPVLTHDTRLGTMHTGTQLEEQGYEVIAYENLSERGQELYIQTLERGGRYSVPVGDGATDFRYPTRGDRYGSELQGESGRAGIVIERPPNAEIPPADEPVESAEHAHSQGSESETENGQSIDERRQQIARYDLMRTRTEKPPLTATSNLLRLFTSIAGVLAIGTGGYLWSKP